MAGKKKATKATQENEQVRDAIDNIGNLADIADIKKLIDAQVASAVGKKKKKPAKTKKEMHADFINLMKGGEYATTSRNAKANVFTDVFERKKYALELFKVLHPEMTKITADDIDVVTLEVTLVNSPYNDLGLIAKDKIVILVEAQSTWSVNILIRILIYLAYTYKNYIASHDLDVYAEKIIRVPKPEFYVVYTGKDKVKDEIRFSEEFFKGAKIDVEIIAKVITQSVKGDVLDQYIEFAHEFDRNREKFGNADKAALNTYEYCIKNGILAEYFKEKGQKEAIGLMQLLFDQETLMRNHDAQLVRDTSRRVFVEAAQEFGQSLADTLKAFIAKFQVDEETAKQDMAEYWKK